jgi:hypothetical protein
MFPAQIYKSACVVALSSMLLFQNFGYSQDKLPVHDLNLVCTGAGGMAEKTNRPWSDSADELSAPCSEVSTPVSMELPALGKRSHLISEARKQVLEILETENTCSAWFQEADQDAAEVFRSLHYQLDRNGTSDIYSVPDGFGKTLFKHPWGAKSMENAGSNSTVIINGKGPFFSADSRLMKSGPTGGPASLGGWHPVMVGPYVGDTPEVRIVIMLHELGHIIGRLPTDDGSWNGESSRNTVEVLRHCKTEIHLMAKKTWHDGK